MATLTSTQKQHIENAVAITAQQISEAKGLVRLHLNGVPNPGEVVTLAVLQALAVNYQATVIRSKD